MQTAQTRRSGCCLALPLQWRGFQQTSVLNSHAQPLNSEAASKLQPTHNGECEAQLAPCHRFGDSMQVEAWMFSVLSTSQ